MDRIDIMKKIRELKTHASKDVRKVARRLLKEESKLSDDDDEGENNSEEDI